MALGLVGRKIGMTRLYTAEGVGTPVTVIEVTGNRVTQVKNTAKDGYAAVQVTVGARRADRVGKALAGKFAKAGVEPGRGLWEFRLGANEGTELKPGAEIKVDIFAPGQHVVSELARLAGVAERLAHGVHHRLRIAASRGRRPPRRSPAVASNSNHRRLRPGCLPQ